MVCKTNSNGSNKKVIEHHMSRGGVGGDWEIESVSVILSVLWLQKRTENRTKPLTLTCILINLIWLHTLDAHMTEDLHNKVEYYHIHFG